MISYLGVAVVAFTFGWLACAMFSIWRGIDIPELQRFCQRHHVRLRVEGIE